MHPRNDIVIGLDVGATRMVASAFDPTGRELATIGTRIATTTTDLGGREQEPGAGWQALVHALTTLATRIPQLADRTIALGITGAADGTWLIDDDGDAVGLAAIGGDRQTATIVEEWQRHGVAGEVERITGTPLTPASQSARLAAIQRERPNVLDQTAQVFHPKDWIHFCATGIAVTEATQAVATWGGLATGDYEPRLLSALGLDQLLPLLPPIQAPTTAPARLTGGAAAALGLRDGTPVVLGPDDMVAAAIAMGAGGVRSDGAGEVAMTWLTARRMHMTVGPATSPPGLASGRIATVRLGGSERCLRSIAAGANPDRDWVIGLAEQLLADAGLIGIGRGELAAILERKARDARPGAILLRPETGANGSAAAKQVLGMCQETTLYDLLRAVHEGAGLEARADFAALGCRPAEIRIAAEGEAAEGGFGQSVLAACLGVPLRPLRRRHVAAAGAALVAAARLGGGDGLMADWVEPHLDEPEPPNPELRACYDHLYARYCGAVSASDGTGTTVDR